MSEKKVKKFKYVVIQDDYCGFCKGRRSMTVTSCCSTYTTSQTAQRMPS